jgi:hypothetical protein
MLRNWNYDTGCGRSRNLTAAWRQWGVSQVPIQVERQGGRGRCLSRNRNDILCRETSHPQSVWSVLTSRPCRLLSMFPVCSQNDEVWLQRENKVSMMLGLESHARGLFFSSWAIPVIAGTKYSLQQAIISVRNCFSLSYVSQQYTEGDTIYRISFIWSFMSP